MRLLFIAALLSCVSGCVDGPTNKCFGEDEKEKDAAIASALGADDEFHRDPAKDDGEDLASKQLGTPQARQALLRKRCIQGDD